MRATKTPAPIETKLNLQGVRVELYTADHAAEPPFHPRAIITIPGDPEALRADLPLSEVLDPKQIAALGQYEQLFVSAVLADQGFAAAPDQPATELSASAAAGEK